jgi:broad specificity phosphatase PhoE
MSVRLTLIAHGATAATRDARFPRDEPLEAAAEAKAQSLAKHIGRVDVAWTSPALRTVQTAEALGLVTSIQPLLADIDLGAWAGKSLVEVEAADPTGLARWMDDPAAAPHGGEAVEHLLQRIGVWLDQTGTENGRIIAVTHPAVIRAAAIIALDAPPKSFWRIDIEPLSLSRLDSHAGRWTVRILNAEVSRSQL